MTEQPVCKIRGGRHPLVELCVDAFVPNDAALVRFNSSRARQLRAHAFLERRSAVVVSGGMTMRTTTTSPIPSRRSPDFLILIRA